MMSPVAATVRLRSGRDVRAARALPVSAGPTSARATVVIAMRSAAPSAAARPHRITGSGEDDQCEGADDRHDRDDDGDRAVRVPPSLEGVLGERMRRDLAGVVQLVLPLCWRAHLRE